MCDLDHWMDMVLMDTHQVVGYHKKKAEEKETNQSL
jgi:hypothetical protein